MAKPKTEPESRTCENHKPGARYASCDEADLSFALSGALSAIHPKPAPQAEDGGKVETWDNTTVCFGDGCPNCKRERKKKPDPNEQPRTAAGDGPKQGCDCPMTPPPFPRKAHSESCPERPDRLTVDGEPKHGSEEPIPVEALHTAAQCWCDPETSDRVMDPPLATAFARRLVPYLALRAENRRLDEYISRQTDEIKTLHDEGNALRAEVGTWREQYEAETRSLQNLVAFALEPITPNYEKPMQGEHNVVRDTLARLFGFEILATQQIDALRAELAAAREEISKLRFPPIGVPPEGSLPHLQLIRKPPSNRIGDNIASVIESGDPDVNAASGACVTDGETSLECPVLPVPGPIIPASDAEIAGWLCGGRDGGCEDWPECEYCRMVARIEVEKARADKAEQRVRELEDMIAAAADVDPKQASYDSTITTRTSKAMRACEVVLAEGRAILAAREQKEGGR